MAPVMELRRRLSGQPRIGDKAERGWVLPGVRKFAEIDLSEFTCQPPILQLSSPAY